MTLQTPWKAKAIEIEIDSTESFSLADASTVNFDFNCFKHVLYHKDSELLKSSTPTSIVVERSEYSSLNRVLYLARN